jgi:hypothetical protein
MDEWADGEIELMELVEQRQVQAAVVWLQQDLKEAKDRVVRTARQ